MFKFSIPILLIAAAIGLFYTYIDPTYKDIQMLKEREQKYDEALTKSRELQAISAQLLSKYNAFSSEDITRLNKLLPDNVDNVRLALDIDGIAARYNMRIKNISISGVTQQASTGAVGSQQSLYESTILIFSVATTYENLLRFLKDLEKSLRIVDVTQLSFSASEGELNDYKINLQTYWLR